MKNLIISNPKTSYRHLEEKINKRHMAIQTEGVHYAKLVALRNQPHVKTGDLLIFIGTVKASYEKLIAEVVLELQPAVHKHENEMEGLYYEKVEKELEKKIGELDHQNHLALGEMPHDQKPLGTLKLGLFLSGLLFAGELVVHSQSLQVTGGNLLSSIFIGFGITTAVFLFAHGTAILYKRAESKLKRRLIFFGALGLVMVVFIALSALRSQFYALHGIVIHPVYFTLFNTFFFIVSFIIALLLFPSLETIRHYFRNRPLKKQMKDRERQKTAFEHEKKQNCKTFLDNSKEGVRAYNSCRTFILIIWKQFEETVQKMKQVNENTRQDCHTPECFKIPTPSLELPKNISLTFPDN